VRKKSFSWWYGHQLGHELAYAGRQATDTPARSSRLRATPRFAPLGLI